MTAFQELPVYQDLTERKATQESALLAAQESKEKEETVDWTESMAHPDSEALLANVAILGSQVTMVFSAHLVYLALRCVLVSQCVCQSVLILSLCNLLGSVW